MGAFEHLDGLAPPRTQRDRLARVVDHARRGGLVNVDMASTQKWNERIVPGRQIDYLILGTPSPGVDVFLQETPARCWGE